MTARRIKNALAKMYTATTLEELDNFRKASKDKCYRISNDDHSLIPMCDEYIKLIHEAYGEMQGKIEGEIREQRLAYANELAARERNAVTSYHRELAHIRAWGH